MSQAFNITARLNLQAPKNLKSVAQQIHRTLSGVGGNLNVGLGPNSNKQLQQVTQKLAGLKTQSAATTKAINATAASVDNFSNRLASTSKRVVSFGLVAGTLLTVSSAIRSASKSAIEYQHNFVKIATVAEKSTKQLKDLDNTIHDLSTGLGVSSRGLTDISQVLVQAGLNAKDTQTALTALAKTNLAPSFSDIRSTVEGSIAIMGQFGTKAADLEKQLGAVNLVSAKFAVESSDLVTAVRKSGAAFHQAGGSLNELLALFTAVRSSTRESADTIGSAFKTIFSRLQSPERIKRLEDLLNIKLHDNGQFVGPLKAIEQLNAAIGHLPRGSILGAQVSQEVGGIRQISKVLPLIHNYDKALQALAVAQRGESSLDDAVARSQESLSVQIQKTREHFQKLFDTVARSTEFRSMVTSVLSLANAFAKVGEKLIPLLPALATLGTLKLGASLILPRIAGKNKGFDRGGFVTGPPGDDTIPARLTAGEYVIKKSIVNRYGKRKFDLINSGHKVPGFKTGGYVGGMGGSGGRTFFGDSYADLSQALRALTDVIKDEIRTTKESRAGRPNPSGSIPLSGDPGYAVSSPISRRQRQRNATAFATQIPLAREKDFATNAFNVVSGRPDDFRARSPQTYGLSNRTHHEDLLYSPAFDQTPQRSRNFRGMSRADREARIADRGYGGLLSSVRRNALTGLQAGEFARRGYDSISSVNSSPGLARRVGSSISGFGQAAYGRASQHFGRYGGSIALGVGILGASGYGEKVAKNIGGDKAGSVVGGALSAGANGAALGFAVGGPMGAAIAGLTAGLAGSVAGLKSFEEALKTKPIEEGFAKIASASDALSTALSHSGGQITSGVAGKAEELFGRTTVNRSYIERSKAGPRPNSISDLASGYGEVFSGIAGLGIFGGLGYQKTLEANQAKARLAEKQQANEFNLQSLNEGAAGRESLRTSLIGQSKRVGDFARSSLGQGYISDEADARLSQHKSSLYRSGMNEQQIAQESAKALQKYTAEVTKEIEAAEKARFAMNARAKADLDSAKLSDEIKKLDERRKGLLEKAGTLSSGLQRLGGLSNDVLNSQHAADNQRFAGAQFLAKRRGVQLTDAQLQEPLRLHNQRLTGITGAAALDPKAILNAGLKAKTSLAEAQEQLKRNPLDATAIQNVEKHKLALERSRTALGNLTDPSHFTGGAEQRLSLADENLKKLQEKAKKEGLGPAPSAVGGSTSARYQRLVQSRQFQRLTTDQQQKKIASFQKSTGFTPKVPQLVQDIRAAKANVASAEKAVVAGHEKAAQAQEGLAKLSFAEFTTSSKELKGSFGEFQAGVDAFTKAAASIPHTVEHKGTFDVNVVLNGAEMMGKLSPELQKMATEAATLAVRSQLSKIGVPEATLH